MATRVENRTAKHKSRVETYGETMELAEKLTDRICRRFEYTDADVGMFLVLIDLFDKALYDPILIDCLASTVRQKAYSLCANSEVACGLFIERMRELAPVLT
jgi:hypothetical protein